MISKSSLSFWTFHPNSTCTFPAMFTQKWAVLNSKPKYQSSGILGSSLRGDTVRQIYRWIQKGHQICYFSMENEYFSTVHKQDPILFLNKKLPERCTKTGQWLPLGNGAMDGWQDNGERFTIYLCTIYILKLIF